MAKKKSKFHRIIHQKISISTAIGGIVGLTAKPYENWCSPIEAVMQGDYGQLGGTLALSYLGYRTDTNSWDFRHAIGLQALVIGALISWGASKIGINRRLRLPFVKI